MIEEGLVLLIQTALAGSPPNLPGVPGGYGDSLPKDTITAATPMAWVYKTVSREPDFTLAGETDWAQWNVQIDCHGKTKANAITLRKAIADVLSGGFRGALSDTDDTIVNGIFEEDSPPSGFSDANLTFVEALEYQVLYRQT